MRDANGNCAIVFRVAFPPAWWILDVVMFAALTVYAFRFPSERPLLLLCLAILSFLTFFALPLKGSAFARMLCFTMDARP